MRISRNRFVQSIYACIVISLMRPAFAQTQKGPALSQAACVIRLDAQSLFIQDAWSHRYALPGGAVQQGEPLAQAAARQTRATTGLKVDAQKHLGALGDTAVFDCRLTSPIHLLPRDVLQVPACARSATTEARFIAPQSLDFAQWRYRSQASAVAILCAAAAPHSSAWVEHGAAPTSALFEAELKVTRFVQKYIPKTWQTNIEALSLLGTETALYTVAVLVWCLLGYRHGLEFMLYMMSINLLNCLLKHTFQLPRPFHLDPLVQLQYQSSFGFPSGHTTCVTSIALWAATRAVPQKLWLKLGLLLCVLACSFSRVYLGVHFVHDVVGAWAESLVVCGVYVAWLRRSNQTFVPKTIWAAIMFGLAAVTLWVKAEPDPIVFVSIATGVLIGSLCCRGPSAPLSKQHGVLLALVMAAGFTVVKQGSLFAKPDEASLAACVTIAILSGLTRGLLMPVVHGAGVLCKRALRRA